MKAYTVLFAQDVPHYGSVEIEASSDEEALEAAKALDPSEIAADPLFENAVCKRIVSIEDPDGGMPFSDVPLDGHFLGLEKERAEMLEALELCADALSDLVRTDDGTPSISALGMARKILARADKSGIAALALKSRQEKRA